MRNRGRPLSRTMIVEHVWDMDYDGLTNIVDVYIRHLRSKIDDKWPQKMIQTVRGIGYMLDMPERAAEKTAKRGSRVARFTRVFGVPKLRVEFMRGLRFRLMLSYVLFFTVLLVVIGLFFRQILQDRDGRRRARRAARTNGTRRRAISRSKRCGRSGSRTQPIRKKPTSSSRIKHIFLITDAEGVPLDYDEAYDSIGIDSPAEIRRDAELWRNPRSDAASGQDGHAVSDQSRDAFRMKRGGHISSRSADRWGRRASTVERFTRTYFLSAAGDDRAYGTARLGGSRAARIQPVNSVAQAAQNITGSNLSLQIPLRGAGDELDHLIDSFNRMTERLNQTFEQIRRFSTDVSHELRTPLTAIRGQLEVALFTAETPEQYRDAMVNALEDVEKLSSIVRALLLLSQAESGQLALQKAPLDLGGWRRIWWISSRFRRRKKASP